MNVLVTVRNKFIFWYYFSFHFYLGFIEFMFYRMLYCENHSLCKKGKVLMSAWFGFLVSLTGKNDNQTEWEKCGRSDTFVKIFYLQLHGLVSV